LRKSESHKACRRLELKDLLPTVLQRLTKYPLLFENLYKVTVRLLPENTTEAEAIQRAVESSKRILVEVNQAVKTAEDAHKYVLRKCVLYNHYLTHLIQTDYKTFSVN